MRSSEDIVVDAVIAQALSHAKRREFAKAAVLLRSATHSFSGRASLWGMLGSMEFQRKRFAPASIAFRNAIAASPKSELASLGLFHSLLKVGKERAAIAELKRFQSVANCKDYEQIAAERKIQIPVAA